MDHKLFKVGDYISRFNDLTGQKIQCGPIFQSSGLIAHIKKHHPESDTSILNRVPIIIKNPDYIGKHPKEPNSIELVKLFENHEMVCIKLDLKQNYLYVASVFEIKQSKLENRINSGRLKKY